ncbi:transcriptional regulator SUPERMAN-like [Populus alba x Populus x berolinensis]|nr:transcriptional regulator SUPERMAN-like [Populus alba x Populus x berolinensis]
MNIHRKDRACRTRGKNLASSSSVSSKDSSSPRQPYSNYKHGSQDFLGPRTQSLSMNEELWGKGLSLQIGSANIQDSGGNRWFSDDDEVDLELRLGRDR